MNTDSITQAQPTTSSAVILAAFLLFSSSAWALSPRANAVRRPASWLPPWGVGTVLQYELKKPSSSAGHATAHSTLPVPPLRVAWPENGVGVTVSRSPNAETRKSWRPPGNLRTSLAGVASPSAISFGSHDQRISTPRNK